MFTIYDYIKRYCDIELKEYEWNTIDTLLCAILAYLPTKGFNNTRGIEDVYDEVIKVKNVKEMGNVEPVSVDMIKLIVNSKRYKNLKFSNFVKLKNDDTQYGAVTLRINNITIVSFQGTDYSAIGWLENFRAAYQYPTYTQSLAIEYLNKNIRLLGDNNVYVVGHSKGGNLAMTSVMEAPSRIYNKVKKVYNFDGPGFRESEYRLDKYKRLTEKLESIVPSGSIIGIIMNNDNYHVIKTNTIGFSEHFPNNWRVLEGCFVDGDMSFLSKELHSRTTIGLKDVDGNTIKEAVEALFKALGEDKTANIKISLETIIKVYSNLKDSGEKVFDSFDAIFSSMSNAIKDKKE